MKRFQNTKLLALSTLLLLAAAPGFAQGGNQGADLFSENCSVCHGADGKGSDRGTAIATLPNVVALSDAGLLGVLHNGTSAGMPAFPQLTDQQAQAVVRYLRRLQGVTSGASTSAKPTGDANAGKSLYFGKAQCSTCHMVNGQGGFMASDMTTYGQSHNVAAILQAIVKPDRQLDPGSRVAEVITLTGEKITGVVRTEDDLELTLQTEDGRYHFLNRDSLAKVTYSDHSLMPHDYGTRLTAQELNDLVSFLIATSKNAGVAAAP
jgi:cytochrome c oxidase cbb3-type subunit III